MLRAPKEERVGDPKTDLRVNAPFHHKVIGKGVFVLGIPFTA